MNPSPKPRILMVDDEPNLLAGYRRLLGQVFAIATAEGGPNALASIRQDGPFPVVVTDMRMPEMDGVAFIAAARAISPDTVFLMLTGNADQATAIRAINEGAVFRFLNKPCTPEDLQAAIHAALRQHELLTSERVLLRNTLTGSVRVLVESLTTASPHLAAVTAAVRRNVAHIADALHMSDEWRFQLAGSLCLFGHVALPDADLNDPLREDVLARSAAIGSRLLRHIPRIEDAVDMIAAQREPGPFAPLTSNPAPGARRNLGAWILRAAVDLERARAQGLGAEPAAAVAALRAFRSTYPDLLLTAVEAAVSSQQPAGNHQASAKEGAPRSLPVEQLRPGMIVAGEIKDRTGKLLLGGGQDLSELSIERIRAFHAIGLIEGDILVRVPAPSATQAAARPRAA
jgi:CheY-like chemotaxis protein